LLLLIPCLLLSTSCAKKDEKEPEPIVPVQLEAAKTQEIERLIAGDGILRALDQSAVMPKISAPVAKFYVNRGDHVKHGQLLATLENRDLRAAVADAKGAYEQASAQYRNTSTATVPDEVIKARADVDAARQQEAAAKKLLESREQLFKEGALARRLVDEAAVAEAQAKSQFETAQKHLESLNSIGRHEEVKAAAGQMESAKGKYDAAETQLAYSEIRSPINGIVAERPLFAGEMANTGSPLLTVVDNSSVIARVNLPPAQAAFVRIGQSAVLSVTDSPDKVQGKVTVVSPAVDPQSTTVEIWVQAANPGGRLRPGGAVHVVIGAGKIPDAIVVPVAAVLPSGEGGTQVLVVGNDMVAHARKAQVGVRTEEIAQIVTGVKPGERVITEGGVGVEDGAKVKLAEEEKKDEKTEKGDKKDDKGKKDDDEKDEKSGGK
jgi:multidrug efflux pump subunit AcrA (membrane-fusion protein)